MKMSQKSGNVVAVLSVVSVAVGIMLNYVLVRYGLNFGDEPYQIMNCMDVHNSPLSPLTSLTGLVLGEFTDFGWMAFRYLAVTLNMLAAVIGCLYLYRRTRSVIFTAMVCMLVVVLTGLSRSYHNVFGWDSWTVFFVVLLTYNFLLFIEKPGKIRLLAISAVSALTVLVRIPNAISVVIVWGFLIILPFVRIGSEDGRIRYKGAYCYAWIYLLVTIVITGIILIMLYGSLGNYLTCLRNNILTAHDPVNMVIANVWAVVLYLFDMLAIAMYMLLLQRIRTVSAGRRYGRVTVCGIAATGVIWLVLMMHLHYETLKNVWYDVIWVIVAFCYVIWKDWLVGNRRDVIAGAFLLLIGYTCCFGSNTTLVKYPGILFVPFCISLLLPIVGKANVKFFTLVAMLPLLITDLWLLPDTSFLSNEGVKNASAEIKEGRGTGIHSVPENVETVDALERLRKRYPAADIVVVGTGPDRFLYEYLLASRGDFAPHDWSGEMIFNTQAYTAFLKDRLDKSRDAIAVYVKIKPDGVEPVTDTKAFLDSAMMIAEDYYKFTVYKSLSHNIYYETGSK